jgi:hypothetical protein
VSTPIVPKRKKSASRGEGAIEFSDLLFLDKPVASLVVTLVYWAGLALVFLFLMGAIGASIGLMLNEGAMGILLAIPGMVIGLITSIALALIWRAFCEFFLAVIRISADLRAWRKAEGIPGSDIQRH